MIIIWSIPYWQNTSHPNKCLIRESISLGYITTGKKRQLRLPFHTDFNKSSKNDCKRFSKLADLIVSLETNHLKFAWIIHMRLFRWFSGLVAYIAYVTEQTDQTINRIYNKPTIKYPTQSDINWFLAGIKPNASHLLELVATATVMFVLIYCSARCLPKYYKDWPALRECNINLIIHFDLRICKTWSQILTIAGLEAKVSNMFCMRYLSSDVLADFSWHLQ